ncbi:hypothetical protein [Actinoplanes sp. NPDC051851]|uniref:hypothetical protein n=1 Tax=Actinoplanes sp. NPDC051851 TaxID=3154753 RepID=UPI00342E07E0
MKKSFFLGTVGALALGPSVAVTPAYAAVPVPDQPCILSIDPTVSVGYAVTAEIKQCPPQALVEGVDWKFIDPGSSSGDASSEFSYEGSALYPEKELTQTFDMWDIGTFRAEDMASDSVTNQVGRFGPV